MLSLIMINDTSININVRKLFWWQFCMGKGGRDLYKYLFTIIMNSIAVCTDLLVVVVVNKQLNMAGWIVDLIDLPTVFVCLHIDG